MIMIYEKLLLMYRRAKKDPNVITMEKNGPSIKNNFQNPLIIELKEKIIPKLKKIIENIIT